MLIITKIMQSQSIGNFAEVFNYLQNQIDGAYNIAILNGKGDFAAYRDKHGFRPLCYGVQDNILFVASEDSALRPFTANIHPVQPGEMLTVSGDNPVVEREQIQNPEPAHCYLEWAYFANVATTIDAIPVYLTRVKLGRGLADIEDQKLDNDCVVIAIPESARAAGKGFSDKLNLPVSEGIIKNIYSGRTFIEPPGTRSQKIEEKYLIIPEAIDGKRIFIVDDSLIRASTLKFLIQSLKKQASPREIHLRIAAPPVFAPCYYGIDIPTPKELFAPQFMEQLLSGQLPQDILEKMAQYFDVDSIRFLPVESMPKAIGIDTGKLCMACITGKYPTPAGTKNYSNTKNP